MQRVREGMTGQIGPEGRNVDREKKKRRQEQPAWRRHWQRAVFICQTPYQTLLPSLSLLHQLHNTCIDSSRALGPVVHSAHYSGGQVLRITPADQRRRYETDHPFTHPFAG